MIIPVVSIYNCILGRPTLAALDVATTTVHLKMKYHNRNRDVATLYVDLKVAARCHRSWGKLPTPQSVSIMEGAEENLWRRVPRCSKADFDASQE